MNVSRAAAARVVAELVRERGGVRELAEECNATVPAVSADTFARGINRVLSGKAVRRDGTSYVQRWVKFDTVDAILTGADRADLWYGDELRRWGAARERGVQPRRYARRQPSAKMPAADVRAAHARHVAGESIRALGRDLWQRYGYASPSSCANALNDAFLRDGLPTRDRIAASIAASTKHGMASRQARRDGTLVFRVHRKRQRRASGEVRGVMCAATVKGRPCRRAALAGGDYCRAHEPALAEQVAAGVARMRARLEVTAC